MKVISLRTWHYLHVAINSSTPKPLGSYQKERGRIIPHIILRKTYKKVAFSY
jgi:hypothetical protein